MSVENLDFKILMDSYNRFDCYHYHIDDMHVSFRDKKSELKIRVS